jgi:hypothetical protein
MEGFLTAEKKAMGVEGIVVCYDDTNSPKNCVSKASGNNSNEYLSVELKYDQQGLPRFLELPSSTMIRPGRPTKR